MEPTLSPVPTTPPRDAAQPPSARLAEAMELACVAAMQGDLNQLTAALHEAEALQGFTVSAKGTRGRSPLYQACLGRRPAIVKHLLELGATDASGDAYIAICATEVGTPQKGAAAAEADPAEACATIMREHGCGPPGSAAKQAKRSSSAQQGTPKKGGPQAQLEDALEALASGDPSLLLERSASGKPKGKKKNKGGGGGQQGELPIHHAARTKATESIQQMLQNADFQSQQLLAEGAGGKLPIHYAVATGNTAAVQAMLGQGVDQKVLMRQVSTPDASGKLPVHYAINAADNDMLATLCQTGSPAQLTTPGPGSGVTAIHYAAKARTATLVAAMVGGLSADDGQAVLRMADSEGRLPVHTAAMAGDRQATWALSGVVAEGVPPILTEDSHGKSALDYAFDEAESAKAKLADALELVDGGWSPADVEDIVEANRVAIKEKDVELEEMREKIASLERAEFEVTEAHTAEVTSLSAKIEALQGGAATAGDVEEGVPPTPSNSSVEPEPEPV